MRLLLRADVDGVGKKGDLVEVADGFGRNYLMPKGLAIKASKNIESQATAMRRSRDHKDAADRSAAEEIAKTLVPRVIIITSRAGTEGRLFGSVTTNDVAEAVREQTGVELDRRHLHLDEPIKSLGTHAVQAKLHSDVEFAVTVEVTKA
jgi:large subunit ribosomal protein L9